MRRFLLPTSLTLAIVLTLASPQARPATGAAAAVTSPVGSRAYVSNEDDESVTVLDALKGEVIANVPVGKRPRGLKLSRDGSLLYVAVSGLPKCPPSVPDAQCAKLKHDLQGDGIATIDTATLQLRGLLKSGSDPEQFDLSPDGKRLYISNEDAAQLTVLDTGAAAAVTGAAGAGTSPEGTASGAIVATIPVGHEPEGVRVAPNGKWVIVTSETDSTISIIDTASLRVLKTVSVGLRPRDLAFTPDSTVAYVSGEGDASLSRVSIPAGAPVTRVLQLRPQARPMGVVFEATRKRIFVTTGRGGTVAVVEQQGDGAKLLEEIPVGARPWGIALSHDGRLLYTANGSSNDVTIVDTSSLRVLKKVPVGKGPWGVTVSP